MTDCSNAEMRDLLPDLASGRLSPADRARVQQHVDECADCAAELSIIRTARALSPATVPIDVARIVAKLPKAAVVSAPRSRSFGLWRMAATLGVIIAGGWSVVMIRSGGLSTMNAGRADSAQMVSGDTVKDSGLVIASSTTGATTSATTTASTAPASSSASKGTAVSFGDLGDYTDDELEKLLDRLDKWDGSTSTETVTTNPILPVNRGGTLQ